MNLRGQRVRENRHPELFKKDHELPKGITVDEAWTAYKRIGFPTLRTHIPLKKFTSVHTAEVWDKVYPFNFTNGHRKFQARTADIRKKEWGSINIFECYQNAC